MATDPVDTAFLLWQQGKINREEYYEVWQLALRERLEAIARGNQDGGAQIEAETASNDPTDTHFPSSPPDASPPVRSSVGGRPADVDLGPADDRDLVPDVPSDRSETGGRGPTGEA